MSRLISSFAILVCMAAGGAVLCAGEVLPEDPGLNGGKGGHWGAKNDKDWVDGRWNNVDIGSFMSCALAVPGGNVNKGIAIRLGEPAAGVAGVCFDGEKCGLAAAWTGKFIHFGEKRYGLIEPPSADGPAIFSLPGETLWSAEEGAPEIKCHYRGMHVNGTRVALAYTVAGAEVVEAPWAEQDGAIAAVARTFQVGPCAQGLLYTLAGGKEMQPLSNEPGGAALSVLQTAENVIAVGFAGGAPGEKSASLSSNAAGRIVLRVPPHTIPVRVKVLTWSGKKADLPTFAALLKRSPAATAAGLDALCQPGPPRWGEPLVTQGSLSTDTKAYVIDTVTVPFKNPFNALFFCSGVDFLSNGDAVVSTLHGDIWLVSGLDAGLQKITWRRFATGLFQAFGVKVVNDLIYVLGRDQITRLHDTNHTGEADFYENFCNLSKTSAGGHDYSAGLETDSHGNFYHVDPFGLHRISPDGVRYETVASGWRNPISLAIAPDDSMTVSPQEGEWTPASEICSVKPGGWYGFPGPKVEPGRPLGYEQPLCYLPRLIDNSSGGMVWAPAAKWGPLSGQLLNLSFGQCAIMLVLREEAGGQMQGGVVPLGLRCSSGAVRGRVRAQDGQLYIAGTYGWVTSAVRDGCLQRVRYTGAKLCIPVEVTTHPNGLSLTFSESLDRASAEDPENYALEEWNYHYGAQYGSREFSVSQPNAAGHDPVTLSAAKASLDGRGVILSVPNLRPAMQFRIKYLLKDAGGQPVRGEIDYTINKVGASTAP